jgi:cytochrome c oxidase subunit 2
VKTNRLRLPKDRPVEFKIQSRDVIHSFWVPQFRLKSDAVPGLTTKIRLTPDRLGRYSVVCAELCGIGHSTMRQTVKVERKATWEGWIASRQKSAKKPAAGGGGGAAPDGKQLFSDGTQPACSSCHTLAAAGATGSVGPNLDKLAAVAAKRKPGTSAEDYVRESIENPQAFVVKGFPENVMPKDFKKQLSAAEIDALVKYLLSVSGGKG